MTIMQSRLSFVHAIDKKITKIYFTYTDVCFCRTLFVGSMRTVYYRAQMTTADLRFL
jgi:hypothetical protein